MGEHLAHEHTTSHDPILTKAIPIPIPLVPRLPPPRRHSDDPGRYRPLPRSPPRLFSFAPTRSSPWSPWSPLEQATEGELEEVFGGDAHPESGDKENHGGANHIPLGEGITPSISTSHVRTPSDSTFPFLGAEVDDADEPVFANFASLHEPTFLLPPSRQLGSPSDRMAHTTELLVEERRSRELTVTPLLRRGSELSFTSGYTSRSTSRGSVREMSPDTWTRRMIKHAKVDAS